MRPLVIDDAARAQIARVLAYAEDNPYVPADPTPSDNPNYVAHLGTYRCVFTFTNMPEACYRHLSVSVPGAKYPNPAAVFMIAHEFGFTGWDEKHIDRLPDGWMMNVNEAEHCVVLGQERGAKAQA